MAFELDELTLTLKRDKSVRAVIFTGTENTYITHMDVPSLLHSSQASPIQIPYGLARAVAMTGQLTGGRTIHRLLRNTPAASIGVSARIYAALRRMNNMGTVFVTAINGLAVGMGFIFAMACDVRIIAEDVQIGLPEAGLGLLAAAGGTQRLVRMVGSARALGMLLNGELLTAQTALQYGLVHDVVARSDLLQQASISAQRLARQSPVINREIKRMIYQAADQRFASAIKTEAAGLITTITSRQARQGGGSLVSAVEDFVAAWCSTVQERGKARCHRLVGNDHLCLQPPVVCAEAPRPPPAPAQRREKPAIPAAAARHRRTPPGTQASSA